MFQDGWAGVQADWMAVGEVTNAAQIASLDYGSNTITLASALTRTAGGSVWLYRDSDGTEVLVGAGPDIGAHERSR